MHTFGWWIMSNPRTRGLLDGSLIAVMADHGEAFGEHGEKHHGGSRLGTQAEDHLEQE